jgi:DNA adenine methylase
MKRASPRAHPRTQGKGPIVGRLGGKSKLAHRLIHYLPTDAKTYVEPFAGSAALFFRRPPAQVEVLNDLDCDIYNILADFKRVPTKTIEQFDMGLDRERFKRLRKTKPRNAAQRLERNLYLSYNSYASNRRSPRTERSIHRSVGDTQFQRDADWYKRRLADTIITNRDFREVLRRYDSPSTLFYLDPPYESAALHREYAHSRVTPQQVADAANAVKGRVAVSYSDTPAVRKAFSGWKFRRIPVHYALNGHNDKHELLITNY